MTNPYLEVLERDEQEEAARRQAATSQAIGVNPDQAARAKQVAGYLGVPSAVVESAPEEAQRRAQLQKIDEDTAASPLLRRRFSNPEWAKLAHDDTGALAAVEGAARKFGGAAADVGKYIVSAPGALEGGLVADLSRGVRAIASGAPKAGAGLYGLAAAPFELLGLDTIGGFLRDQQRQSDQVANYWSPLSADAGLVQRGVVSGLQSAGQTLITLPLGLAQRGEQMMLGAMGAFTAGQSYGAARDKGLSPARAIPHAAADAVAEVITERYLGAAGFLQQIKAGASAGKLFMYELLREVPGEMAATLWQNFNEWANLNPEKTLSQFVDEQPAALAETAIATLVGGTTQIGVVKSVERTLLGAAREQVKAAEAESFTEHLSDVLKALEGSKLRQRDLSSLADFVQEAAQEAGHDGNVYVDAAALADVLNQSGVTPEQLAAMSPTVAAALSDAVTLNGTVAIPVGELVGKFTDMQEALLPHLRPTEDGLSQEEAKVVTQQAQQYLEQAAARVIQQAADTALQQLASTKVAASIVEQLNSANRFTKDVNEAYGALVAAFYTAAGQRHGLSAEEMFARYPLRVQAVQPEGASIEQDAAGMRTVQVQGARRPIEDANGRLVGRTFGEQQNFWKWFGDSKVVDASGKPQPVYHGTGADFEAFGREHAGKATGAANAKLGFFFTNRPDIADRYAGQADGANVMPAYLSLRNPLRLQAANMLEADRALMAQLTAEHDGAVIQVGEGDRAQTVYMVRGETQAKSAIGNRGTFDPNDANILHQPAFHGSPVTKTERDEFFQGKSEKTPPRGTFSPASLTITLLEKADLSTFLHETGHFFLEAMSDMAAQPNAPADLGRDMLTVLEWFGVRTLEEWNAMTLEQQRPYHEKFAESFEQYLFEGKAPSRELSSLFGRFRAWLTNVYRSLQQFMASYNTQLTDEVRHVFDRLIATQEQIEQAEEDAGFASMLEQFKGKVDPALLEHYQRLTGEATEEAMARLHARSLRDLKWIVNARGRELKRLSKDVAEKRKAVEAEVTAEVDAAPEMQAAAAMEEMAAATPELKDARKDWRDRREAAEERAREEVKAKYNAQAAEQGLKGLQKGQYLAKNKKAIDHEVAGALIQWERENQRPARPPVDMNLDAIAERFGFSSGDHMLQAIDAYGPRDVAIEGITNQRMLERFGDLVTPEGLQRAANEAVHNEARARAVAAEMQALQASVTAKAPTGKTITAKTKTGKIQYQQTTNAIVEAARRFAVNLVARRKVRDLKAGQHQVAERKAGKLAMEAAAKGKSEEAMAAKRDQLLNFYASKETLAAIDEIEKGVKYLRKVADSETLDADYRDQIAVMLERFDLRPASNKALDRRATLLEWVEEQRTMGIEPEIPPALLNEAVRQNYRDMTVEEFRGLVDTVKQMEHLGRLKHKLLTAKDEREFADVVQRIVDRIIESGGDRTIENVTPNTELGKKLHGLQKFAAQHVKAATWARVMDGGKDGGPLWEYIIRAANEAGNKEVEMRAQATRDLSELVAPLMEGGKMDAKLRIDAINTSLNRQARLAVALNMGNASNLQRLMGGHWWTAEQVAAIGQTLTEQEWRFVQKVWDYFGGYRAEIGAKEKRVSGVEPKWIEPTPLELHTADGKDIKLRGGYYPVKFDPEASHRAEAHADAEGAKQQMRAAYTAATTRRSFTKTRADEVTGRPLMLSLDGIYQGVNEVIHDLSWHEFLIDANRLVGNDKVAAAMRQKFGAGAHQQFKSWLQDVAKGETSVVGEGFAGWLRSGVSIAGLGFNIMSAAIQPLGITQSITRVGAKWVGRGIARYTGAPLETTKLVHEKSTFMAHRAQTRLRELAEVQARIQGRSKLREGVDIGAYYLMLKAQQAVDVPTWVGAYEKATVEGGFDEDTAVQLADQAVIDAQGSGTLKDQAAVERGGQMKKLLTVFYSFFNTTLNNLVLQTYTEKSRPKLAADYLLLVVVPVVLGAMLRDALTAGDSGDWEDPRKIAKRLIGEEISFLMGLMFGVREFTAAAQAVTGTAKYSTDYSGPAGVRMVGDVTKLGVQANQGELDPAFRKALVNVAGEVLRLPSAQINRSITGYEALRDGKTSNPLALLTGYQEPSR